MELKTTENIFIGGLSDPENIQNFERSLRFFHGCIMGLEINEQKFILQPPPFGSIIDGMNIGEQTSALYFTCAIKLQSFQKQFNEELVSADRCQTGTVADREAPSCVKIDCMNGGRCLTFDNDRVTREQICDCAVGFIGSRCEIGMDNNICNFAS